MLVSDKPQPFPAGHNEHRIIYRLPYTVPLTILTRSEEVGEASQREFEMMLLLPSVVTSSTNDGGGEGRGESRERGEVFFLNQIKSSKHFSCMSAQAP